LFAARGYGSVSIAEIAQAAGIDKGHVYYHFRYKERLLDEIVSPLLDAIEPVTGARRTDRGELIDQLVAALSDHQAALRVGLSDRASVLATTVGRRAFELRETTVRALAGPRYSPAGLTRASSALAAISDAAARHDSARPQASARKAAADAARRLVA
jgi:AcrR family transcriptional regulator